MKTRAKLNDLYVGHTGQPLEDIERTMDRDTWFDVTQVSFRLTAGLSFKLRLRLRLMANGEGELPQAS